MRARNPLRSLGALALLAALLAPGSAGRADDTVLFSTSIAPNVMVITDNSGSMENIAWHPSFDPTLSAASYSCNAVAADQNISSDTSQTHCGITRTLYADSNLSNTIWERAYVNWYFSLDSTIPAQQTILTELAAAANGTYSNCLGGGTYSKYRRSRITALQDILRDVICQVNAAGSVRFGLAQFRDNSGFDSDPEGGHVTVPIANYSAAQDTALQGQINNLSPDTWTPLGETLYQIYTYFMSRTQADRPFGKDGTTRFPNYSFSTSDAGEGGAFTNSPPASPVQYHCQKNFVILITDGEPTKDDFDTDATGPGGGTRIDLGFSSFVANLIGDYATGDVAPGPGSPPEEDCPYGDECAFYLDDIAKFMQDNDFRPDLTGVQNIDVYTVGFTTAGLANQLLQSAATLGHGQFYSSSSAEQLTTDLISAITDIIQKSQAFTAATVPATRTADQGNFYSTFFIPSGSNPFWEGHIKNFTLNAAGEIRDANGACAVQDPVVGQCKEGPILGTAVPHWDAADAMPAPVGGTTRSLYTSVGATRTDWNTTSISAANLGVTFPPPVTYPNSGAANAEDLADEIVQYIRGCEFGTGVSNSCLERVRADGNPRTLGDIFHSDPIVVGPPNTGIRETSYVSFATTYGTRERLLMTGANDGFLHAFSAGTWVGPPATGAYDRGNGVEKFGYMPWYARTRIKNLPVDTGARDFYFVDGSPSAADVWFYPTSTTAPLNIFPPPTTKSASDWKTVVIGSMRQGGPVYFALDATDPGSSGYPGYLWEFPRETETRHFGDAAYTYSAYMGEGWSDAVIARVKVAIPGDVSGGHYERWVAIFGMGYDPTGDPNHVAYDASNTSTTSRKGRGVVMVDVKTGRVLAAHFYHHNDAQSGVGMNSGGAGRSDMRYAFASAPAVIDADFDGYADLVYIGDLGGNLWKWVIQPIGEDTVNPISGGNDADTNKLQSAWSFGKLFEAPSTTVGGSTYYKSFFFPPAVTYYGQQLWLAVGTGERANPSLTDRDTSGTADNNRFYAIKDPDTYALPNMAPLRSPTGGTAHIVESDLSDLSTTTGCPNVAGQGYFIVGRDGEKWVTEVDIIAFYVLAGSFTPTGSTDPCDSGGTSTLYIFRVYCGEGAFPSNTGADQRRIELGDGMPTSARLSLGDDSNDVYVMTSENVVKKPPTPPFPPRGEGIFYWRER